MSLVPQSTCAVPEETVRVANTAFPKGNPYLTLRDEFESLYADEFFASLFPFRGQPAESPGRLAWVTVLQFAEGLSDRQAADAVRSRIDWKYLLGLELDDAGFDFSVLSEFRQRILNGGQEERLLDEILERFRQKGVLKSRGQQRTDSTHVQAAVRTLNRLECIGETLRHALESLAKSAPVWLQERVPPSWYQQYGVRFESYRLPQSDKERKRLGLQIGQDGWQLLTWVYEPDTPQAVKGDRAVELLRRVWIQQYTVEGEALVWRNRDDLPSSAPLIQSPYDPEARYSQKRQTEWFGYKVHITETCDDGQPHLITHVETTPATTQDEQVTDSIHAALAAKALLPQEHLLDRGYVETRLLVEAPQHYGVDIVGPVRVDSSWQAQTEHGFDVTCFAIDWEAQIVTCPQGRTSRVWSDSKDQAGNPRIYVRFAKAECQACPLRSHCTRSLAGSRTLSLKPRSEFEVLHTARRREQTPEFKLCYNKRAGIEGTISQATRAFGLRRSRYIGFAKTHLQHIITAVAINLARFVNWFHDIPCAATRISHFAALAPP